MALSACAGSDALESGSERETAARLAFPPEEAPRSRLLIDPSEIEPAATARRPQAPQPPPPRPEQAEPVQAEPEGADTPATPSAEAAAPVEDSAVAAPHARETDGEQTQQEVAEAEPAETEEPEPAQTDEPEPAETDEPEPAETQPPPEPQAAPEPDEETPAAETPAPETPSPSPTPPADQATESVMPDEVSLEFAEGAVELDAAMRDKLLTLARGLRENEELRVQLLAYASGYEEDPNRARRISLSRALAVRTFLLDQGVRSTRMDVRALGRSDGGPADRVDIHPSPS